MCHFFSHIEKLNHGTGEKKLLYLTDKEVFSSYGKKIFKDELKHSPEDVMGHHAIEIYFGMGGLHCEHQRFWEYHKFPKEIAEKLKDFNKHFGLIFDKCFTHLDYVDVILYHPNIKMKRQALDNILRRNLNPVYSLITVVNECSIESIRLAAWNIFASRYANKTKLEEFILEVENEKYLNKAVKLYMSLKPSTTQLLNILLMIDIGPEKYIWNEIKNKLSVRQIARIATGCGNEEVVTQAKNLLKTKFNKELL